MRIRIRFVGTWKPQIDSVKAFLDSHGIRSGSVGRDKREAWQSAYRLDICEVTGVLKAARMLVKFTAKKNEDFRIAIDYFEGRATGN